MGQSKWKIARRWMLVGFDRTLMLFAWFSLLAAGFLLSLSMLWHSSLSPFQHPGASPDSSLMMLLTLEAIRWGFMAAAACATAMLRGPGWRKRMDEFFFIAWMMRPVVALVGSIAMLTVTAVLWFLWIGRLPDGDRYVNGLLAALYFLLPMAQLAATAAYLIEDPDDRVSEKPPPPPAPHRPATKGKSPLPHNVGRRPPAKRRIG
jgi:hypothetical protein